MSEPRFHQLVHTLSYGDAISSEVLALKRCLQSLGYESEVYAINIHPNLKGQAQHYEQFSADQTEELLLHFSLGSPLNDVYAESVSCRRYLIFHNLTPAHWFKGVNPRIVKDIEEGAKQLPELCNHSDRVFADSRFNASELAKLGYEAEVLELPVDPARWDAPSNPGIRDLVRGENALHVVHVGRLAPNKCIEDIIKSFYFLHHYLEPNSRLWLVGIDIDTELYSFALRRMVYEFELDRAVNFVGCLADSELRALYEEASVYLCMSEHEGFCLPVIEAMHFGLPVVAYASSAIPDTVGSGGVLVREKRHAEIAALMIELSKDTALRQRCVAAGTARVESLAYERFAERVRTIFGEAVEKAA